MSSNPEAPTTSASDALPSGVALQDGAFVIKGTLSQGSFGILYTGRDLRLARPIAIKEFFPAGCLRQGQTVLPHGVLSAAEFDSARARFLDEARTLAQFRHPGIVEVYAFFEANGTAYMVMEYLNGQTLQQLTAERGALPEAEAIAIAVQIAEALEVVHATGLLHRDIKPENVIITPEGRVTLVDFGLTTKLEAAGGYGTRRLSSTARFGTPGYAPLEQYTQAAPLGVYTDIYALGATLYHLLTGEMPPPATDRAYGAELPPPQELASHLSQAVSEAVCWAMQLQAALRPQSVREWQARLTAQPAPAAEALAPAPPNPPPPRPRPAPSTSQAGVPVTTKILPPLSPTPSVAPMTTEQTCIQACFIGCLVLWAIRALVYFIVWLMIAVLMGG